MARSLILSRLAAAALTFAFPRRGRCLALAAALMTGIAIVQLTRHVLTAGVQVHRVGGGSAPLGIDLRADGLSVLMLLITALIGLAVSLYAQRYFTAHEAERPHEIGDSGRESAPSAGEKSQSRLTSAATNEARNEAEALHRERYFWPLFLFLWTALNALFLSADIFNLYVTLELLGFAAVTLVALAGKRAALTAALRYLFVNRAVRWPVPQLHRLLI